MSNVHLPVVTSWQIIAIVRQPGWFFWIYILLIFSASIMIPRWARRWVNARTQDTLRKLAGRLGFTVTPDFCIPRIDRSYFPNYYGDRPSVELGVTGQVNGRQVRFSEVTWATGRGSKGIAEMAVSTRANQFTFSMSEDVLGNRLSEKSGEHRIKTGDEGFDKRWRVLANDETTLRTLLLPELRARINELKVGRLELSDAAFILEDDWIRYRERASLRSRTRVTRYESMVGLMCDLAVAVEAAAEKFTPPASSSIS